MNLERIRAMTRAVALFFVTTTIVSPAIIRYFFVKDNLAFGLRVRKRWARQALKVLGVRVSVKGTIPSTGGPFIYVGNHRSYFDPVVLLKDLEVMPVAKAEVSAWPLIGLAARATGIMYVKRESKESRQSTLQAMEELLRAGYSVLVYPEGTTHLEAHTIHMKAGAFRLAASLQVPLVPVAIEYEDENDAWIGNDTFVPHFLRTFGRRKITIGISYGPPCLSADPAGLIGQVKAWLDAEMSGLRAGFKGGVPAGG